MDERSDAPPSDCDSCGDTTEVILVRRVYLPIDLEHPPGPEGPTDDEVTPGELEWWCEVCRIHYPHQVG